MHCTARAARSGGTVPERGLIISIDLELAWRFYEILTPDFRTMGSYAPSGDASASRPAA